MGLAHSPRIVTDNLLLYLDAGNTKCYPGTGTTWVDLSNNGYGASLVGNTTFSSSPNKFDTNATLITDQNHLSTSSQITLTDASTYSFEFIVKLRASASATFHSLLGKGLSNPWLLLYANNTTGTSWYISYRDAGATYRNFSNITDYNIQNNWAYITLTVDYLRNINFYLNGVFKQTLSTATSTAFDISRIAGGYQSGSNYYSFQGSIALAKIYTKTLAASEVTQNFNALRGRYGI